MDSLEELEFLGVAKSLLGDWKDTLSVPVENQIAQEFPLLFFWKHFSLTNFVFQIRMEMEKNSKQIIVLKSRYLQYLENLQLMNSVLNQR